MHPLPAVPQQRDGHALPITPTSWHQPNLDLISLFQFLFGFLRLPEKKAHSRGVRVELSTSDLGHGWWRQVPMQSQPQWPGPCQEFHGQLLVQGRNFLHVSGQIGQGVREANEALRNSAGLGSQAVFLAYFCFGS